MLRILLVAVFWLGLPALSAIQARRSLQREQRARAFGWLFLASVWLLFAAFTAFGLDEGSTYSFVARFTVFAVAAFAIAIPILAGVQAYRAFKAERHLAVAGWLLFGIGWLSLAVFGYFHGFGGA